MMENKSESAIRIGLGTDLEMRLGPGLGDGLGTGGLGTGGLRAGGVETGRLGTDFST
jgi:hypothetical protein